MLTVFTWEVNDYEASVQGVFSSIERALAHAKAHLAGNDARLRYGIEVTQWTVDAPSPGVFGQVDSRNYRWDGENWQVTLR